MEPGPIRVQPLVNFTILSRSGSPTITAIIAGVSITMSYLPKKPLKEVKHTFKLIGSNFKLLQLKADFS